MLAPPGVLKSISGGAGKITYVAVKGKRIPLSLLYPYCNQVLANDRGCWTA